MTILNKCFMVSAISILSVEAMVIPKKKESDIIYTEQAIEQMINLKVSKSKIEELLLNGYVNKDRDNKGVLLYSQRSPIPSSPHANDQLVVAVAEEPYLGKKKILDIFYNENVFVKEKNTKKTAKEIRDATLKSRIQADLKKHKERQDRIAAKAKKLSKQTE